MKFGKLLGAAVLLILLINKIPASFAQVDLEIKLKNRRFVPQTSGAMRVAGSNGAGRQYIMLQFAEMPDPETLAQYDIQPLNYIPDNAIMASVPAGFDQRNAPGVHWMGQLLAADKISAHISKQFAAMAADQQFTLVVEAHPDVDAQTLASLAAGAGGAFDTHPDLPGHLGLVTGAREVFQQLALDERIVWITAASDGLVNGEAVYYCPGPITEFGPIANYVVHDDGWDGPGRGAAALTYHFLSDTTDIAGSGEEGAVRDALAEWSNYADLSFSETPTAGLSRSLDILWATGAHGDSSPFDGPGGVLAHAYFPSPPNSEPIAGDMHFDDDETWSLTTNIHMFTVALHEAGHSLGLGHSDVSGSVMYAYYGGAVTGLEPDDIAGIRAIYSDSGSTEPAPDPPVLNSIDNGDGDGNFTVSWSSVANATSYTLQEQYDGGSWNTIYSGNSISHSINGRSTGEYCYRVLASNAGGDSAWSNTQCATVTEIAPDAPVLNSIANSDEDGTYTVSWSNIANATSYNLQERLDGGSWKGIYSGSGNSHDINGRSPGEYCYRVLASNTSGDSAWSNTQCTTVTEIAPDAPVLNSIANSDEDGTYAVSWSNIASATSYNLQEQHDGGSWNSIYSGSGNSHDINGRSPGEYCYRVLASNAGGDSAWSSTECTTVTEIAPDAPVLNNISNPDGNGTYTVSWSNIANATRYNLQERHDGGSWNSIYSGSDSSHDINGRSPGEYCYRVLASNANGDSAWSSTECTTVTEDSQQCFVLAREHTGFGSDIEATPTHSPDCPEGQYTVGTIITLSAAPDTDWYVTAWSNTTNDASTASVNSITMPAQNHSVGVHYAFNARDFIYIPSIMMG